MVNNKLLKILTDKTSGSTELLIELHHHLKGEQKILQLFPEIIDIAKKQLSSFQSIQTYLDEMKSYLKKEKNLDNFFIKYDQKFIDPFTNLFEKSKKSLLNFNRIITISNSRTVFEILIRLKKLNKDLTVVISESRPKYEGRILANKFIENDIPVELITEAMIFNKIQNCDAALIGADKILGNKDVINKVGSSLLALASKNFNKPFYVVSLASKVSKSIGFDQKKMPPEEIWRHSNKKLLINNFYFEKIEKKYITKIILG